MKMKRQQIKDVVYGSWSISFIRLLMFYDDSQFIFKVPKIKQTVCTDCAQNALIVLSQMLESKVSLN